jgi:putative transposase
MKLRAHFHCVYEISYHLVLVTKYRHPCISKAIQDRLEDIFSSLLTKWDMSLDEFNGESDHVHLLIKAHPSVQMSKIINTMKTVSSRMVRKEFLDELKPYYWKPYFWHRAYCLVSTGGAPLEIVKNYIQKQGKAHSSPTKLVALKENSDGNS